MSKKELISKYVKKFYAQHLPEEMVQEIVEEFLEEVKDFHSRRSTNKDTLLSITHLLILHPLLVPVEAARLLRFCKKHTINYESCYGDGSIMYPKWKESLK